MALKRLVCIVHLIFGASLLPAQSRTAIVHDNEIYILGESPSGPPRQLTHDGTSKYSVHWSPSGDQIAFIEDDSPGGTFPKLKVVSLGGAPARTIPLLSGQSPSAAKGALVPQSVGVSRWLGETTVALEGSLNRWVCELIVVDLESGKVLPKWDQLGQCGTFAFSPDLQHVLTQVNGRSNAESDWWDSLAIDRLQVYPLRGDSPIRFVTEPHWSDTGALITFIERRIGSTEDKLVVTRPTGEVSRILLLGGLSEQARRPLWISGELLLRIGSTVYKSSVGTSGLEVAAPELTRDYDRVAEVPKPAPMPEYCARSTCTEVAVWEKSYTVQ